MWLTLLLKRGANRQLRDKAGHTALDRARDTEMRDVDCLPKQLLIEGNKSYAFLYAEVTLIRVRFFTKPRVNADKKTDRKGNCFDTRKTDSKNNAGRWPHAFQTRIENLLASETDLEIVAERAACRRQWQWLSCRAQTRLSWI